LGARPVHWTRIAGEAVEARAWPEPGTHSGALVRIPKEKEALAFALGGAAARVPAGAVIAVAGQNAEGARSAGRQLERFANRIETVDTRHHCRIIAGRRRADLAGAGRELADWRRRAPLEVDPPVPDWTSYPGLFAGGRLDDGTRLLISALPALGGEPRVLDFACGTGVIAHAIRRLMPDAHIEAIDHDALAVLAAGENVAGLAARTGRGLSETDLRDLDLIVSNPPLHDGIREDLTVLRTLVAEAPERLTPTGQVLLVIQRRIRPEAFVSGGRIEVTSICATSRFEVHSIRFARASGKR
ncbi:MAG TPA: methyltransferase, partial [Hyphomicrobiaceae bacterium]|nr:methyltransferase [Hyphomicrobiaceae bacterium]